MTMPQEDLVEFRNRCLYAAQHGFSIGRAEEYLAELAEECEVGEGTSAQDLFVAADMVLQARLAPKAVKKKAEKVEKVVEKVDPPAPPPPPPPAPVVTKEAPAEDPSAVVKSAESGEPGLAVKVESEKDYDSWTTDQLYAELSRRDIPNRSKMSKVEQIAALKMDDVTNQKA